MYVCGRLSRAGFTLIELIVVLAGVGILAVYAVMNTPTSAEITLPSQAQKLAGDIRRAQTLAYTSTKRMLLTVNGGANGTYSVTCVTGVVACNTSNDFSVTVQKGVVLAGPNLLYFNSLGQPADSNGQPIAGTTVYTLTSGSTETISVAPLTGLVTVSP
jgi:prepilin-type N-terminal cleavage/methylation domain-containing protein